MTNDDQKQMITGHVTVLRDGKEIAQLTPARWFFAKHEDQPTTEVAIRRATGEDLYVVLAAYEVQTQNATYAVTVNPLVNWIWFGFAVLAFGTGIAMLPERALALAGAKVPEGAVTTSLMLLLMLMPAMAGAQTIVPRSELRRQLEADLMCKCGGCKAPMNNCQMGPGCHGLQGAEREARQVPGAGDDARADPRRVRRRPRRPGHPGGADRRGLQPPRVGAAVCGRPHGRRAVVGLVALRWTRQHAEPEAARGRVGSGRGCRAARAAGR